MTTAAMEGWGSWMRVADVGERCFVDDGGGCGRVDIRGGCWREVFMDDWQLLEGE